MGGKKQARTKNNAQPSSSDRHAQRLGAEPLIGFSALSDLGYVPAAVGGAQDTAAVISGQLRALLKKMEKKDAITKAKAVQEFAELCDSHDLEDVKAALPFWPRLYRKLATDVDNRVRELSHVALQRLVGRVRRASTPHMADLVPVWLCCLSDPYPPAASAARRAFQSTFPVAEKQTGVVKFCYSSILNYVKEGLYELTAQTYSDSSTMTADELEARYIRLLTGCLSALRELAQLLPPQEPDGSSSSQTPEQPLADIVTNNKFCKLAKHGHPQVRRWWFSLISGLCARRPALVTSSADRLVPAVVHGLPEQDPAVLTDVWDAAICLATTVPDCWSHVNLRKAVLPQLWATLREGGRGCAVTLHPLMIILLSKLPPELAGGDQPEFHRLFFSNMLQGLSVDRVLQSRREVSIICRTLLECALYVLRQQGSEPVVDVIVEQLCALTGAAVSGGLVRLSSHVLPALSAGLNSLYTLSEAGAGATAAAQSRYWDDVERAILREHLSGAASAGSAAAAGAAVDLLLSVAGGAADPPASGRQRVTFSEPSPAADSEAAPAGTGTAGVDAVPPLAASADSPLCQCAARAAQRLVDQVRAASADADQRRQLARLLVGVPGVAERVAVGPAGGERGRQLFSVLLEPELTAGRCELPQLLLPTVCRLCQPQERRQLAQYVTQKGYMSVVAALLELAAGPDPELSAWAVSEEVQSALLSDVLQASSADSDTWRHALRAVPLLLDCHADQTDSDPAAALLSAVTERLEADGAAGVWRLEQLAALLAPPCRSADALLRAHGAALLHDASPAALAALQDRLVVLDSGDSDLALADQLRTALGASASCAPAAQRRLRAITLRWARLLGAGRFSPLLPALLPASWTASDERRAPAQLCLLLRRRTSLRPAARQPPADCRRAVDVAGYLRALLVELAAEWPAPTAAVVARYLPDLLNAHVVATAAAELAATAAAGDEERQAAEDQLAQLVASLAADQVAAVQQTVVDRAIASEDGVEASSLALLLRLSKADDSSMTDTLQDDINLLLPCVPLLPDTVLLSLVSGAADGSAEGLLRLSVSAAALRQLSSRHGDDWALAEAGSNLITILDAVVRARDTGQLPCTWEEAGSDWHQMTTNLAVLHLFSALLDHCSALLESTHWDMLLLAVSSWLAALQEPSDLPCLTSGGAAVLLHALCGTVEVARRAVLRCADQNQPLAAEWDELYAPEWHRALLAVFASLAVDDPAGPKDGALMTETLTAVCAAVLHAPCSALLQHALPARLDAELDESHLSVDLITVVSWWRRLLASERRCVRLVAWQLMHRFLPSLAEAEHSRPHEEDERSDPRLALPTLFRLIIAETEPLVTALLAELSAGQTCLVDPGRESHRVVLIHLMAWHLALSFTGHQHTHRKVMTAEALRENGRLDVLLNHLFCLMPESPEVPESYVDTNKSFFELEPVLDLTRAGSAEEVQHWACRTYVELLRQLPVLARAWRSGCERPLALRVERLTSEHVSPLLLADEFRRLQEANTTTDNMTVRARPSVREVSAIYTMEEASTELVVRLPADYPLGPVVADAAGRRVGVAAGQWRMWMLQLTTFLTHQNGSVLDGLLLWKQNIDKRFQGVEECNICFYVLHGTNYQLPKLACRNCKKRFHAACLYKWFSTSSKSTCPMCRQLF